ncbi:MAG: exopolysaccharide biosynthesis polyprenyl glycosylphosphotransferase [Bacteroidetes bacterium]|nr:exopolysaccharide biosynthesis polyprenyl glycosylphosphotransferase [Bacteroidota bacterium]
MAVLGSYRITGLITEKDYLVNVTYLVVFSNLSWLFLIIVSNPYGFTRGWGTSKYLKSQISYVSIHLVVVAFLIFFFKRTYLPIQILALYALFVPFFFGWKILVLYVFTNISETRTNTRNMIILGSREDTQRVRRYFLMHPEFNLRFLERFKYDGEANLKEINEFIESQNVHVILCCERGADKSLFRKLINLGLNHFIQIKLISISEDQNRNEFLLEKNDHDFLHDRSVVPLDSPISQFIKRSFDLVFSSLVIVLVLSWLLPVIGLLIKLESKGPVFFVQRRGGLRNRNFSCIKFRTMIVNSEADRKQATKDDPRITTFGRFLRKSSLDEFPQFLNVFLGDMSLIGPRPHPLKLNEEFSSKIEGLMSRHYVKPGITGLAQSMGYRGETKNLIDMQNRIAMDIFYIENWSLWLDIKIIIRTIISLVKGSENAY